MAEHTRDEWHTSYEGYDEDERGVGILVGRGINEHQIAWVGDGYSPSVGPAECEATARQIAREHNMHPRLVDALKEAQVVFDRREFRDLIAEAEKEG